MEPQPSQVSLGDLNAIVMTLVGAITPILTILLGALGTAIWKVTKEIVKATQSVIESKVKSKGDEVIKNNDFILDRIKDNNEKISSILNAVKDVQAKQTQNKILIDAISKDISASVLKELEDFQERQKMSKTEWLNETMAIIRASKKKE